MEDLTPSQEMEDLTPSQETALCLLVMFDEMLTGAYKPRQPDEERGRCLTGLVSFIRTGQCLPTGNDGKLIDQLRKVWRQARQEALSPPSSEPASPYTTG